MKDWTLIIRDYHVTIYLADSQQAIVLHQELKRAFRFSEFAEIVLKQDRIELTPGWLVDDLRVLMDDVIMSVRTLLGSNGRVLSSILLQELEVDQPFSRYSSFRENVREGPYFVSSK